MHRMDYIRSFVSEVLEEIEDPVEGHMAMAHLYGVSQLAALLALQRGLDSEIAAISGLLHDMYTCRTGFTRFHDQNGAEYLRPVLRDSGLFSLEEQTLILTAIFHHSDKQAVNDRYPELLKDADVLQHYCNRPDMPVPNHFLRLERILGELALPFSLAEDWEPDEKSLPLPGKGDVLASIAEKLAGKDIKGTPEDQDYLTICRYWPEKSCLSDLKGNWCAAFVYHCCMEAGFYLPLRHPLVSIRFAGVGAWLEWARLPEAGFFFSGNDFEPRRGDIVIFDKLVSDKLHDHIGIVLTCGEQALSVAEGNADNMNRSGIVVRGRGEKIAGFIRIPDGWIYQPSSYAFSMPKSKNP